MGRLLRLPRFRVVYPVRGLGVWIVVRFAAALAGMSVLDPAQSFFVIGVVALVVWLDARRRDEHLFLGNLGIPSWVIPVAALPLPLALEILLR